MSTFILIAVGVGTFYLARYAIREGIALEQNKKLEQNMENYDRKYGRLADKRTSSSVQLKQNKE